MDQSNFEEILELQIEACRDILVSKGKEYGDTDRLHNFRTAAELEHTTMKRALAGMMAKHTVSIYDMCRSEVGFTDVVWEEKITDHMNYLILLRAVVTVEP